MKILVVAVLSIFSFQVFSQTYIRSTRYIASTSIKYIGKLKPLEIEFNSFKGYGSGVDYFSSAFKTIHHSGDKINYLSAHEDPNGMKSFLIFVVRGADAVNARSIYLKSGSGLVLKSSTCYSICVLSYELNRSYSYGLYQTYPGYSQTLTLRVRYHDGSLKESLVKVDPSMSL